MMGCGRKIGDFNCCEVYCCDCLEAMKALPAGCVDAVITDPPYGISYSPLPGQGRMGKRVGSANSWHTTIEWDGLVNPSWISECSRVGRSILWFCDWSSLPSSPLTSRGIVVWAKDCHTSPPSPFAHKYELIAAFGDIHPERFETNLWFEPIIPTWEHRHHPTEKPESLMVRCVRATGGATILDPFLGSGTTVVAALKLGRHFLGFEISEEYCAIARKRIALVEAQPTLFEKPKVTQAMFDEWMGKE